MPCCNSNFFRVLLGGNLLRQKYPAHIVIAYPVANPIPVAAHLWKGGQSSFTMSRLNLNLKILGEILVSNPGGRGQSSFTMSRVNLNLKILGGDSGQQYGWSIIFHHVQAKSELKILGEILVSNTWGAVPSSER